MNLIEWKWMKYSFSNFLGIIWRIWLVSNVLVHWIHWDMDTCPKLDTCPYLYVSSATDEALDTISTLIWKHNSNSSPLSFLFFFWVGGTTWWSSCWFLLVILHWYTVFLETPWWWGKLVVGRLCCLQLQDS